MRAKHTPTFFTIRLSSGELVTIPRTFLDVTPGQVAASTTIRRRAVRRNTVKDKR